MKKDYLNEAKWQAHWLMSDLCIRLNATIYERIDTMNACYAMTPAGHTFCVSIMKVPEKLGKVFPPQVLLSFECDVSAIKGRNITDNSKDLVIELLVNNDCFYKSLDGLIVQMIAVNDENYNEIVNGFVEIIKEVE